MLADRSVPEELRESCHRDVTVHACVVMYLRGEWSEAQLWRQLALAQSQRVKELEQLALEALKRAPPTPPPWARAEARTLLAELREKPVAQGEDGR